MRLTTTLGLTTGRIRVVISRGDFVWRFDGAIFAGVRFP